MQNNDEFLTELCNSAIPTASTIDIAMLFADEDQEAIVPLDERAGKTWCVLMVDDDAVVHTVTRLALRGYEFQGRTLEFISAYSAKEGQQIFQDRQDIALAMIDVVMERDQAGLDLVQFVRKRLQNHITRLVVRTGQPGLLPFQEVLGQYEIDDYQEKTELTIQKLRMILDNQLAAYQVTVG